MKTVKIRKRCFIERLSKFVTYILVSMVFAVATALGYMDTASLVVALISTTLWFITPDITAYLVESIIGEDHKTDVYR